MPTALPASFGDLRQRAAQLTAGKAVPADAARSLASAVPPSFTWTDLARELAQPDNTTQVPCVLALRACLDAEPSRLVAADHADAAAEEEAAARRQISRFVVRVVSPIVDDNDDDAIGNDNDDDDDRRAQVVRRCALAAADAVAVLRRLQQHNAGPPPANDADADADADAEQRLFTLIALADAGQPWTTDAAAAAAGALVGELVGALVGKLVGGGAWPASQDAAAWLVGAVLQRYLRPLFARARPAAVTASGRPAAYRGGGGGGGGGGDDASALTESRAVKPWKYGDLRAVPVVAWAVARADAAVVGAHWPLFVPVLLALVDDPDTGVRARGLELLLAFLGKVPEGDLLHRTGLDRVLADAVFPTLLFLPRLTPAAESLRLLPPAYGVLLALARAAGGPGPGTAGPGTAGAGAALLDRVLRDGVFAGYFHAREHGAIVAVLVQAAGRAAAALGVGAAKHLRHLVPLLAGVLADPFAVRGAPAAAAAAADALQATLAACWPRFAGTPWQAETTRMLMVCWLQVEEEAEGAGDERYRDLRAALVRAADTLLAILRAADVDVAAAVGVLVAEEPRLGGLFRLTAEDASRTDVS